MMDHSVHWLHSFAKTSAAFSFPFATRRGKGVKKFWGKFDRIDRDFADNVVNRLALSIAAARGSIMRQPVFRTSTFNTPNLTGKC